MAKGNEEKTALVNPFDKGVNYKMFIEALGKSTVKEYLKDVCTESEIEFIENELLIYKNKK